MLPVPLMVLPIARRLLHALLLGLGLLVATAWSPGAVRASSSISMASGTVGTLAGPGYCKGTTFPDQTSGAVRSLAVDPAGRIYYDLGRPEDALVATVDARGRASVVVTGIPARRPAEPPSRALDPFPVASRLAPDGTGGIVIAAGTRVVQLNPASGLTTLAGDSSGSPGRFGSISSGDGGPAAESRFVSARSIASDEAGNLYVADSIDTRSATVRVRFVNRGSGTVKFYAGTPQQLSVAPGHIATVAGMAGQANSGDGGAATRATLRGVPPSLAVAGGRLYIGLSWAGRGGGEEEARVRVVNLGSDTVTAHGVSVAPGHIETVAGGSRSGYWGDGEQALAAAFSYLPGIAVDAAGNLLLADERHQRVRKVDGAGVITTIAGTAGSGLNDGGFNGNDKPATTARLHRPFDVKAGPRGQIYISDQLNGQVRVLDATGMITAVPGGGLGRTASCGKGKAQPEGPQPPPPGPGGPSGVAVTENGTVYFSLADMSQVKRIEPSGVVTTVVGTGDRGFGGENKPALKATLNLPTALAAGEGGLYVFDAGNARVRFVNLGSVPVTVHGITVAPRSISTVAGNGRSGLSGDGGKAVDAQLGALQIDNQVRGLLAGLSFLQSHSPLGALAIDDDGNLFIADHANNRVRQVDRLGLISTVAGEGSEGTMQSCCRRPLGLALDSVGNLYVSDSGFDESFTLHPRVWLINRSSRPITRLGRTVAPNAVEAVAGSGRFGSGADEAKASEAQLLSPAGLAVDSMGELYIAEVGQRDIDEDSQHIGTIAQLRKVAADGSLSLLAGNGQAAFNGDGLKAKLTSLNFAAQIALDPCGNVLIADLGNDRVRRLSLLDECGSRERGGGVKANRSDGSGSSLVFAVVGLVGFAVCARLVLASIHVRPAARTP